MTYSMIRSRPTIAIAMGDPTGIGPEITVKAVKRLMPRLEAEEIDLTLIGSGAALDEALNLVLDPPAISRGLGGRGVAGVRFVEVAPDAVGIAVGELSAAAGEVAYQTTVRAVELVRSGKADAIVTAPLSKEAMYSAGRKFAGYTELLSHLTGSDQAIMMLAHDKLRVSHITTHVPLHDVPRLVTPQRVERVIRATYEALLDFDIESPRIAVAALNPHAGEGGNFGHEDDEVTRPIIRKLIEEGFQVEGPVPGDTVFVKTVAGQYDAVVAMYHDQGHIPVKLLGFKIDPGSGEWLEVSGVNITLGLPIIRTSVDHGTALDIAGQGIANESSLIEAIEVAERLVAAKTRRLQAGKPATQCVRKT